MRFRFRADAAFHAANIDQAFLALADHFRMLAFEGIDASTLFDEGEVTIEPEKIANRSEGTE